MRPVLFELFGFPIRSYGFFIAVAILASLWLARRVSDRRGRAYGPHLDEFITWAVLAAIVGARVWEVIFAWEYYGQNLVEIPQIWKGGISIQGAIVGGLVAGIVFTRVRGFRFWDFADTLAPAVLLGQGIGRLGACLLNGDAFGKPTGTSFGIIYQPGTPAYETFGAVPLWPAEVFEGIWDLIAMAIVLRVLKKERPEGTAFLVYVILYSLGRFTLEFLRADSLMVFGLKAAQLTSLFFMVVGAVLLYRRTKRFGADGHSHA